MDDFDLGPGEGETTPQSVSALTESPRDTSTADQFLLPCEQFTQPWLTLLPTEMTAPLSTDFKPNPEVPTSDQTLENSPSDYPFQEDTTDQLDPDLYELPPPSDEEYSSNDENECEAMFNLPAPVPYPLWHGTERHTPTADTGDLRHHDLDPQTPPPVMVVNLPPEDVKPPSYPGIEDVCSPDLSDPWELQEIVVERPRPRPKKLSPAGEVPRVPPSSQTDKTMQYLAAKGDDSTHTHPTAQVRGRNDSPEITVDNPATLTPETQTTDSIKSPVTVTGDTDTPAPTHQTVPKTAQDKPTEFLTFDAEQPAIPPETTIAANATRMRRPKDLSVEVRINGKPTRCLVDTGAAVSVLDAKHFVDLYDGNPPSLKPSTLASIRTVSGEAMPIRGIL